MATHTITKQQLEDALHNVNVLIYAIEEVLLHAKRPLAGLDKVRDALAELRAEFDAANLPSQVSYEAAEPSTAMLAGEPADRLRKNMCTP